MYGSFYELRKVGKDFSRSLNYIYFTIFYAFALHFYILKYSLIKINKRKKLGDTYVDQHYESSESFCNKKQELLQQFEFDCY